MPDNQLLEQEESNLLEPISIYNVLTFFNVIQEKASKLVWSRRIETYEKGGKRICVHECKTSGPPLKNVRYTFVLFVLIYS